MGREGRDYWEAQLSEYWDSGLTIQEYSELKELPYESTRRWIRVLEKARQDDVSDPESLELELGFEQVFYFFEFFRRASGLTPMEFRRRSGKL